MRSYFMTGCTGWIGRALVAELIKHPDTEQIVLLTRNAQSRYEFYSMSPKVKLYEGDILTTRFPEGYFTNIIHGANEPLGSDASYNYYVMVEGTQRMLDWAYSLPIRPYILLLSSGGATRNMSYGRGKLMTEFLLQHRTILGKIARIYTLVGSHTPIRYAIGNFIRQAIDYGGVRVAGGQNVYRSYMDVADAARAIVDVIDNGPILKPVDIGGRQKISVHDAAKLVAEVFDAVFDPVDAEQPGDVYLPETDGAHETISLRQSLERIRDEARLRSAHVEPAEAS